jgi:hypothetical protein
VRQAGSEDPVRRCVVDTERETAIQKIADHARDAAGGRCSEGRFSRRVYPETSRVGDCPGSSGPATLVVAKPGGAESVKVGVILSSKTPVKATDRRGISRPEPDG